MTKADRIWLWGLALGALGLTVGAAYMDPVWSIVMGGCAALGLATFVVLDRTVAVPLKFVLLLTFLLPFERLPSVPVGGADLRLSQLVAGLALIALGCKFFLERWRVQPYPAVPWLVAFLTTSLIGVLQAANEPQAIKVFVFTVFAAFVSVIVVQFVRSKADLQRVIGVLAPSVVLVILFALYQTAGDIVGLPETLTGLKLGYSKVVLGFPRPMAFSIEPLYLANYLFLPLGVFGALWLSKSRVERVESREKSQSLIPPSGGSHLSPLTSFQLGAILIGIILVMILTISRGAYIALVPFMLVFILLYPGRTVTMRSITSFVISMGLIGAITVGFLTYSRPDALEKFVEHAQIQDLTEGESTQGRLLAFTDAFTAWQTKPTFGIGMGNFGSYVKGYPLSPDVAVTDIVNNEYLEVLAETGWVGFVLLTCFVIALVWRQLRALFSTTDDFLQAVLVGLLAAFIAILTQYNFFSTLYVIHIWFLIGLMVAVQNIALLGDAERSNQLDESKKTG